MTAALEPTVGRITVEVELANESDVSCAKRGYIEPDSIRRITAKGVVDTGAAMLVIPEPLARTLGLDVTKQTNVSYADGRTARRNVVGPVVFTYLGRSDVFSAVSEPNRETVLIGAIVLEALDLIIDCKNG